jgi:acyl carrier protein
MKPMTNVMSSERSELIAVVGEAIRSVSAKARTVPITPASLLLEELALDSLDLVAVIVHIQDHFGVEIDPDEIPNLRSVDDLVTSLKTQLQAAA